MLYFSISCVILSLSILVNGSITAAISSQQNIKLEHVTSAKLTADKTKIESTTFIPKIIYDKEKTFCENNICNLVQNFSLSEVASIECTERFLSIEFEVTKSVVVVGFIDSNSNQIYLKQEYSKTCSKIKRYTFVMSILSLRNCISFLYRYLIDSRYQIILVGDSIQLVGNKDIEFFIGFELLKNLDFLTFITYKLGAYDESTDTVIISKLLKVKLN
jgi:hypothetical protein